MKCIKTLCNKGNTTNLHLLPLPPAQRRFNDRASLISCLLYQQTNTFTRNEFIKKKIVLIARLAKFHEELSLIVFCCCPPFFLDRYVITKYFCKTKKKDKHFHIFNSTIVAVMKSSNWNSSTTRFFLLLKSLNWIKIWWFRFSSVPAR
jgi:hypothetical protein